MKHTTNINTCGIVISVYDNAWQMKLAYIETLSDYFVHEQGCFEIINDIEIRIAELMQEIMYAQRGPINEINMQHIIRIMGTAGEFMELDTDDWDIVITSNDHCNTNDIMDAIKSGYSLNKNAPKLCYN